MDIGNTLGNFIKGSEQMRQRKYISYARICIYLDIFIDFPDGIELTWEDEEWFQAIDYEQIPFCCRRCHEHGHLFRYCPQNKRPGGKKDQDIQDAEGFTKIQNKKCQARKILGPEVNKRVQTQNRYETRQEDQANCNADKQVDVAKEKLQAEQQSDQKK